MCSSGKLHAISTLAMAAYLIGLCATAIPSHGTTAEATRKTRKEEAVTIDGESLALKWSDEFSGAEVDNSLWYFRTDTKKGSLQLASNSTVSKGRLQIRLQESAAVNGLSHGGGIISKKSFGLGYFEARIRIPQRPGWHSAFWLAEKEGFRLRSSFIEVDIMENDSQKQRLYYVNTHLWPIPGRSYGMRKIRVESSLGQGFNLFGCLVREKEALFFYNRRLVHVAKSSRGKFSGGNIWISSIKGSVSDESTREEKIVDKLEVDYVRHYR